MPSYPLTLPVPKPEGFSKKVRSNTVRTETAQGYQRVHQRFTGKLYDVNVELTPLTTAQLATFLTFYNDTLSSGSLEFDWYDFSTNPRSACTYRFGEQGPEATAITKDYWRLSFGLELRQ